MKNFSTRGVAAVAVFAVALTACGTDADVIADGTDNPTTSESPSETTSEDMGGEMVNEGGDPFELLRISAQAVGNNGSAKALAAGLDAALGLEGDIESPAAQLRATLNTQLQEHVYLAAIAVDAAYSFGADSAEFGLAAGALDVNTVELADIIGSVAPDDRDAFLGLWREHIGFFVNYAVGAKTGDTAMVDQAKSDLAGYGAQAGAFFERITGGELPASAVEASLVKHVESLGKAIEDAAAGNLSVFDSIRAAAADVGLNGSSLAITKAVVAAAGLDGDPESPAATTYATLSVILEEHVYLAGIAVKTAYAAGADSDAFAAAAATLDANSVALADVVGSVVPDKRDAFLGLWREHISFFVNYAVARAGDDVEGMKQALSDLETYGTQSGAFFEEISGGNIPSSAVQGSLQKHVDTLTKAIDALAAAIL